MFSKVQEYAKFVVALLGFVVTGGVGLVPAEHIAWIQFLTGLITVVAVYAVPNKPASE